MNPFEKEWRALHQSVVVTPSPATDTRTPAQFPALAVYKAAVIEANQLDARIVELEAELERLRECCNPRRLMDLKRAAWAEIAEWADLP